MGGSAVRLDEVTCCNCGHTMYAPIPEGKYALVVTCTCCGCRIDYDAPVKTEGEIAAIARCEERGWTAKLSAKQEQRVAAWQPGPLILRDWLALANRVELAGFQP